MMVELDNDALHNDTCLLKDKSAIHPNMATRR